MDVQFSIGDHIMQQGHAFEITSIKVVENKKASDTILHYRPVFEVGRYKNMQCSIPLTSLSLADIRRPIEKEAAQEIMEILTEENEFEEQINLKTAKTFEDSNINTQAAKLAARLAVEKRNPDTNFSSSKNFLLEKLINNMAQEFAVVYSNDLEKAEILIREQLGLELDD